MSKKISESPKAYPNAFDDRRHGGIRRMLQCVAIILALGAVGGGLYMILGAEEDSKSARREARAHGNGGVESVDMGLSVQWASCNLGAESPEQIGNFYAWGECEQNATYSWRDSKSYNRKFPEVLTDDVDVAATVLGDGWRMPTDAEVRELMDKCEMREVERNGCYGFEFVAPNGSSIFLPAAGYRHDTTLFHDNIEALYWSASSLVGDNKRALALYINNHEALVDTLYRYYGAQIRPVKE